MYTTLEDFKNFLKKAFEQEYEKDIKIDKISMLMRLEEEIMDTEVGEHDITLSNDTIKNEIGNIDGLNYENLKEIYYEESHIIFKRTDERICYFMFIIPIYNDAEFNYENVTSTPLNINYFINILMDGYDKIDEKIDLFIDSIINSLLDLADEYDGQMRKIEYDKILNNISKNKKLIIKNMC